jgi:hypothetical protein
MCQEQAASDGRHAVSAEGLAGARDQPSRIEDGSDLAVRVPVEQTIDQPHDLLAGPAFLPRRFRPGHRERARRAALEADLDGDVGALDERDVFEPQSRHALALPVRRAWVPPEPGKIPGQSQDPRPQLRVERQWIGLASALVLLVRVRQGPQPIVPFPFERIGDQAVVRIDLHVATTGQLSLVAGPVHLFASQAIRFVRAHSQLLLHGQGDLEGHGRHHLDQQFAHRPIAAAAFATLNELYAEYFPTAPRTRRRWSPSIHFPRTQASRATSCSAGTDADRSSRGRAITGRTLPPGVRSMASTKTTSVATSRPR